MILSKAITRFREMLGRRSTLRAHFWQSAANYAQQGGMVLVGLLLARLLSPSDFGVFSYSAAIIGLALLPLDWTAAQVLVADGGKSPHLYSEVMSFSILVMLTKILVTAGVAGWQYSSGEPIRAALICLTAIPLVAGSVAGVFRSAAEGAGRFKANFHVQILSLVLSSIVGIAGALAGWGPFALAVMGVAATIPSLLTYPRYVDQVFSWRLSRGVIASRGVEGFWMWLNGISEMGLFRVDKLMLGRVANDAVLGNYNRAYNYTNLSSWALNSFMTNPAVVSFANAPNAGKCRRILLTNAVILSAGATLSFCLFFFFSDPVVPWIFGKQWEPAIPAFRAFSPLNYCMAFLYLPATYLLAKRHLRQLALSRLTGLVFFLVTAGMFAKGLDAQTTAIVLQASLVVSGIACWLVIPDKEILFFSHKKSN